MKFKCFRFIFILLSMTLLVCSCSKEQTTGESEKKIYEAVVNMDGQIDTVTRAENTIYQPYIVVFDNNGKMVDWKGGYSNVSFSLPQGAYKFYGVVGFYSSNCSSETTLLSNSFALSGESSSHFTMIGKTNVNLSSNNQRISISAKRGVAKVVMRNVKINFTSKELQGKSVKIESAYLINATQSMTLGQIMNDYNAPSAFYNTTQNQGQAPYNLYSDVNLTLSNTQTSDLNRTFYTLANVAGSRKTKFILQCLIDGSRYYYPVEINPIYPNREYVITSLNISKLGITNPDGPWVDDKAMSFSMYMRNWLEGGHRSPVL